jgi:hypothetical protein
VTTRSPILIALTVAALCGVTTPAAHAAWSAPRTIVPGGLVTNVTGAGNRHGAEAFAWVQTTNRSVHVSGRRGAATIVRTRIRLPDGRLGRVQTISSSDGLVAGPQIGVDDAGNVTAVWSQAGRHLSVVAAYRPHGKRFGRPVEIGRSRHFNDARPALAVGPSGDAVVAWNEGRSVRVARRGVGPCRCFGTPRSLPKGSDQTVAIGPRGSAYVVWAAELRPAPAEVDTRLRLATYGRDGRVLGREHYLTTSGDASQPALAVQRDGTALVAWRGSRPRGGEVNDPGPIMAAASAPDGPPPPAQDVAAAPSDGPQLRVNARGEAILAWTQFGPAGGREVAVALRPAGASAFGAPGPISPPNVDASTPSLALDSSGSAHLLYSADGNVAVTQIRPPTGIFGAPVTLPTAFSGGSLLEAGAKVTAVSGFLPAFVVSDWTR